MVLRLLIRFICVFALWLAQTATAIELTDDERAFIADHPTIVVAEGVETQAQMDYLIDKSCNYAQGYFFSEPVTAGAIFAFPLALMFGWFFDVTPAGIVRTPPAERGTDDKLRLRPTDYAILAALIVVAKRSGAYPE